MEMDFGSVIVGCISILVCIIPFVIMYYNRISKENKVLKLLKTIAQKQNCTITQYEFCGDFVIGIDENNNWVFLYKDKKNNPESYFVNLANYNMCQVVKKANGANNNLTFIERVELKFVPKNGQNKEIIFELYDEEINRQLSGEIQLAEKWTTLINARIK